MPTMKTATKTERPKRDPHDPRTDPQWKPEVYSLAFDHARRGYTRFRTAEELGVTIQKFKRWVGQDPSLRAAIEQGKEVRLRDQVKAEKALSTGPTFAEYVAGRLPDDLLPVWNEIYPEPGFGLLPEKVIENLFRDKGEWARKHLYVHALTQFSFNPTEACRRVNVTQKEVTRWAREDPDFGKILQQVIFEAKRDFVEGALFSLIGKGSEQATIFAAKTLLRDRGYSPEVTVKHQGGIVHAGVDIDKMPLELKKKFYQWMQDTKQEAIADEGEEE